MKRCIRKKIFTKRLDFDWDLFSLCYYFNLKRISGCSFSGGFYGFSFLDSLLYTWGIEYEIVPFICILSVISIIVLFSVAEYITINIMHKMKKK